MTKPPKLISALLAGACLFLMPLEQSHAMDPLMPITLQPQLLHSGTQCGMPAMGAQWIDNEKDLAKAYARMGRYLLGSKGQAVPQIDFKQDAILLVAMGQKMTGGYAIKMSADPVTVDGQTATLTLRWIEPQRGGITIQVLTSPCILIKMAKGDYTHVKVLDQSGTLRAEVNF